MSEIDLSEVEFKLENAENFLRCFSEFCDNEGFCPEGRDAYVSAFCFINRMPQFLPLLRHAIELIREQRGLIAQTYEHQRKNGEEVVV